MRRPNPAAAAAAVFSRFRPSFFPSQHQLVRPARPLLAVSREILEEGVVDRSAAVTFAVRLLTWFDEHRRDLPWRRTRDPWSIWVSEIMLQQTRVEAVRERFVEFLASFPTPAAFAQASDEALLLAWRGLGYYRRARLLRDAARVVADDLAGRLPHTAAALARLPGVGRYTGGAIASIAFGEATPAVDGNVERVAARHRGIDGDVRRTPARRRIAAAVARWLDPHRPGDFNQALMELGALVCTPSSPRCADCPVADDCVARHTGSVDRLPVRRPPRTPVAVTARAVLVLSRAGALGARIPAGEPNAGQLELPGAGMLTSIAADDLAPALRARYGARLVIGQELGAIRHAITHHRIRLVAHAATVRDPGALTWHALDAATPWSTPARKLFRAATAAGA
jgi:A/G-specific adenine glycosylase